MATAKIAISLDEGTVKRLDHLVKNRIFPSRSKVIQDAVEEKLKKMGKGRLARECAKLDPEFENLPLFFLHASLLLLVKFHTFIIQILTKLSSYLDIPCALCPLGFHSPCPFPLTPDALRS